MLRRICGWILLVLGLTHLDAKKAQASLSYNYDFGSFNFYVTVFLTYCVNTTSVREI